MKKELIKNKIFGVLMIGVGMFTTIATRDATFLILALIFGFGLIIAKENYID